MRLLYVCNDFGIAPDGTKGASIHLRAITRALAGLGHELLLLSPCHGPGAGHPVRRVIPPGCPTIEKTSRQLRHWLDGHGLDTAVARELRPLLYNEFGVEAAMAALENASPDAVIERLALNSCLGLDIAKALNVPLILEVNALLTEENARFRSLCTASLAQTIERRMLTDANALTVVSQRLADRVKAQGAADRKVHVVPNGADIEMFAGAPPQEQCKAALGFSDAFVIGFTGSMKIWHGVDHLLTTFSELTKTLPNARLLLVGKGPMDDTLRTEAQRMGLADRVVFAGAVPHGEIPKYVAAMDVAVAPFKAQENFYFSPIKIFEYMAAGVCVVASRIGQIDDIIDEDVNGLLFEPENLGELRKTLLRAHGSRNLRLRLGQAAQAKARAHFTWEHAAQATVDIINHCRGPASAAPDSSNQTKVMDLQGIAT
jgi:glycosyltransferase involved in cell wall biosynthesis